MKYIRECPTNRGYIHVCKKYIESWKNAMEKKQKKQQGLKPNLSMTLKKKKKPCTSNIYWLNFTLFSWVGLVGESFPSPLGPKKKKKKKKKTS